MEAKGEEKKEKEEEEEEGEKEEGRKTFTFDFTGFFHLPFRWKKSSLGRPYITDEGYGVATISPRWSNANDT